MPLYTFLHNLLNVLIQIANKMGLQKNIKKLKQVTSGAAIRLIILVSVLSSGI
jgi:hypothetical protein